MNIASAGRGYWTGNGPFGASITAIAARSDGQVIYAGTELGEIFRSSDGGANWVAASPGIYVYPYLVEITSIAIDPVNSSTVFAGAFEQGIFKSTDAGTSWVQVNSGFTSPPSLCGDLGPCSPNVLAVDPSDGQIVLAGTNSGLFRTADGGEHWFLLEPDGYPSDVVQTIAFDPNDTDTIYVGESSGFYKTTDGGETWSVEDGGLIEPNVISLIIDPADASVLYAVDDGRGPFRISGGGATWTPIPSPLSGGVQSLLVDPRDSSTLYAVFPRSIFRSFDGGIVWQSTGYSAPNSDPFQVALFAGSPPRLIAGTGEGFLDSTDEGTTWTDMNQGIREASVSSIAVGPIAQPSIFAAVSAGANYSGAGYIAGGSAGATDWPALPGTNQGFATSVVIDPIDPVNVYASTDFRFIKSTDGGRTWETTPSDLYFGWLAVDATNPMTIYSVETAGITDSPIVRSTDGGDTWIGLPFPFNDTGIPLLPVTYSGIVVDPIRGDRIYVAGSFGIARSTDGGETWIKVGNGYPAAEPSVIAIDPNLSLTLYAGASVGVFKTVDGGDSWVKAGTFSPASVQSLAVDPTDSRIVYAGTQTGIEVSRDGGTTWSDVSPGLPRPTWVLSLAVDSTGNRVFAGTNRGAYEFSVPPVVMPVPSPVDPSILGRLHPSLAIR